MKVSFTPGFVDTMTIGNFKVICESGNELPLTLKGHSRRFNVSFSANTINFGEVKL